MLLDSKVAVVTGGAQGLGRGIARRFGQERARVVIADVDETEGRRTVSKMGEQGVEALFVETDVSRAGDVERLFERTVSAFGGIDVLVNNAGLAHGPAVEHHFLKMTEEMWDRVMSVNLKSVYLCSWHAAQLMKEQRRGGCIINVGSGGGTRAHRHRVAYDATKGAIEAMTRAMALDLAPLAIRVNAVIPGAMLVEQRSSVGKEGDVQPADVIPLGRLGTPEDVGAVAAFLASENAAYVTGAMYTVDGGLTAQLRPPLIDTALDVDVDGPSTRAETAPKE